MPTGRHFQQEADLKLLTWNDGRGVGEEAGFHQWLPAVNLRGCGIYREDEKSEPERESKSIDHA